MEILSSKSSINVGLSVISLIVFMFIKLLIFFYSTRVAAIQKDGQKAQKGYKKYYYNFLFLGTEREHTSFYSSHQIILNMLKDPVLGFALVFFYHIPMV